MSYLPEKFDEIKGIRMNDKNEKSTHSHKLKKIKWNRIFIFNVQIHVFCLLIFVYLLFYSQFLRNTWNILFSFCSNTRIFDEFLFIKQQILEENTDFQFLNFNHFNFQSKE